MKNEEFKRFVRTKPELIKYVQSGEMTWQKFYEMWSLYGNDDKVWEKYKVKDNKKPQNRAFVFVFFCKFQHGYYYITTKHALRIILWACTNRT